MLGSYLFNKITVSLNNGLDMASELDEGSYNHVSVHDDAGDKIAHKHKI